MAINAIRWTHCLLSTYTRNCAHGKDTKSESDMLKSTTRTRFLSPPPPAGSVYLESTYLLFIIYSTIHNVPPPSIPSTYTQLSGPGSESVMIWFRVVFRMLWFEVLVFMTWNVLFEPFMAGTLLVALFAVVIAPVVILRWNGLLDPPEGDTDDKDSWFVDAAEAGGGCWWK